MDRNFRMKTLLKLAEDLEIKSFAGMLTDKVKKQFENRFNYGPTDISLSVSGTSIISPGPDVIHSDGSVNILFFFRGGNSSVMSKSKTNAIVVTADAGSIGGGPSRQLYGNSTFINSTIESIITQLKQKTGRSDIHLGKLGLAGWSGGYDPIHGILEQKSQLIKQPDYVGVFDGMHHTGKNPKEADPKAMQTWKDMAESAAKGNSQFVVTHTAVDPVRYASSTTTSNWLVDQMNLQRKPVEVWKGIGKRPESIAQDGSFKVVQLYSGAEGNQRNQHMQAREAVPDYLPNWN